MADLPGSPRAHVWVGLVLATVGLAVGGYAYTGPRAYRFEFIFVALLGFLLLAGGSLLTGYGQANRPRMGKPKRRQRKDKPAKSESEPAEPGSEAAKTESEPDHPADKPPWSQRFTGWIPGLRRSDQTQVTVACPACEHVFETRGQVPFEAICPNCAHQDQVGEPQEVEMTASSSPMPGAEGRPDEPSPAGKAPVEDEAQEHGSVSKAEEGPGLAARARDRIAQVGSQEITATLACSHCEHVFTATGRPPFRATCPNCASTGRVDARSG